MHYIDDPGQPGPGGPTNVVDDYSHVIWLGFPPLSSGTVIKFL